MTKPKMSNSSFIALSCELAHNRVLEDDLNNEYCSIKIKDKNNKEFISSYTELGQDLFNEYYDYYQEILRTYIKEETS